MSILPRCLAILLATGTLACTGTAPKGDADARAAIALSAGPKTMDDLRVAARTDRALAEALSRFEEANAALARQDFTIAQQRSAAAIGQLLQASEQGINAERVGLLVMLASVSEEAGGDQMSRSAIQRVTYAHARGNIPYNSIDGSEHYPTAKRYVASLPNTSGLRDLLKETRGLEIPPAPADDESDLVGPTPGVDPAAADGPGERLSKAADRLRADDFASAEAVVRPLLQGSRDQLSPSILVEAWILYAQSRLGLGDARGAEDALAAASSQLPDVEPSLELRWLDLQAARARARNEFAAAAAFGAEYVRRASSASVSPDEIRRAQARRLADLLAAGQLEAARSEQDERTRDTDADAEADATERLRARRERAALLARSGQLREAAEAEAAGILDADRGSAGTTRDAQRRRAAWRALLAGDNATAARLYAEDLAIPAGESDARTTRRSRSGLARALLALDRSDEAEPVLAGLVEELERDQPPGHPELVEARRAWADACDQRGRQEEAAALRRRNLRDLEELLPPDHPDRFDVEADLHLALRRRAHTADADADAPRETPASVLADSAEAGRLQRDCRLQDALVLRRRILKACVDLDPAHPTTEEARRELAALLRVLGNTDEARELESRLPAGAGVVEAGAARRGAVARPPSLRVQPAERATGRQRVLEVRLEAPRGLGEIVVRQDGVLMDPEIVESHLTPDAGGRGAVLRLEVEIPAGRFETLITVAASDRTGTWTRDEAAVLKMTDA